MTAAIAWRIVTRDDLPRSMYGFTDFEDRTIVLRERMTPEAVHCTLVHELTHVERGPFSDAVASLEEAVVDIITTARVVPASALPTLAERVASEGLDAVADALSVDPYTVDVAQVLARAVMEVARPHSPVQVP